MKPFVGSVCLILLFLFIGCTKNETKFYNDEEDPGLSIFSNTQNNIPNLQ